MKYGVKSLVADNSADKRVHGHRLPTACTLVTLKTLGGGGWRDDWVEGGVAAEWQF